MYTSFKINTPLNFPINNLKWNNLINSNKKSLPKDDTNTKLWHTFVSDSKNARHADTNAGEVESYCVSRQYR